MRDLASIEGSNILTFKSERPFYNGNAGFINLSFPDIEDLTDENFKGEVVFEQIDGSVKTIIFPFYPTSNSSFEAIIAVPYRTIPGEYEVSVSFDDQKEGPRKISTKIKVLKAVYGKDKPLTVDPNTVKPDPESLKRIEEEQIILDQIYASSIDEKLWTPPFVKPVKVPQITSYYGNARVYNGELASFHSGLDYRGNETTDLYATNNGVVRLMQSLHYTGNTIIIDHGKGMFTLYGHMSKFSNNFKIGDTVKKGQFLGKAGRTGRVTGPHLHWGLKLHYELVNPLFLYQIR